jgi:hypothetical protein
MEEILVNLHMHSLYSDGHATHAEIARAALKAGLDAVIVTDHNVYVDGPEDIYTEGERRVLLLVGEEIHDQARQPQGNHLLVFGVRRELAGLATEPRRLFDAIRQAGGLAFIAHPADPCGPAIGENSLSWQDWEAPGYTGLEIWNAMSEFKGLLTNKLRALYYVFNPRRVAHGPSPEALQRWDALLESGQKTVAVGGTDAHAIPYRLGPIRRVIFPYEFHFQTVNTHLLVERPLSGELESDRKLVLEALGRGRSFIGYDLPAPTRGFRFTAHGYGETVAMGEEISAIRGVTLQIRLPQRADCRLIRHGQVVESWTGQQHYSYITSQPGAYRVEAYIDYLGKRRGWIFSNPIYVKSK